MKGNLYLIPTSLFIGEYLVLPTFQADQIKHIKHFVVENAKCARVSLKLLNLNTTLQELELFELNKHKNSIETILEIIKNGFDVGLMSDVGCPAIADPGSKLVLAAHNSNTIVIPLIGPSSILLSLMASGMNGQSFTFCGYLPSHPHELTKKLLELESISHKTTQIFIETPFRSQIIFEKILKTLKKDTIVSLSINLMSPSQEILTMSISNWRQKEINVDKQQVIFLIS